MTGNNFVLLLFAGDLRTFHTLHTLQQIQLDAHRETSQTELSLNLKRIAQQKGFVISCNQGEGNCMFFALSEQLDVAKGMRISHEEIRQTVVCFLRDSPTLVSKILAVSLLYFTSAFVRVFYNLHQQTVITYILGTIVFEDIVSQCCKYLTPPSPLTALWWDTVINVKNLNFFTTSLEHFFCSAGGYAYWTTLTFKRNKRLLWHIVPGVGNKCMLLLEMRLYNLCNNSVPNKNRIFMVSRLESKSLITNKHGCTLIFLSCSQMEQSFSNLFLDTHLGMITWQAWWQTVHGVITWFSMVRQTALKHVFTWSAVCRIIMTS